MSDYTKTVDYAAKDALSTGAPAKVVRGTEIGADFDAIAIAIATKYDVSDLGITLQQYDANIVSFPSGTKLIFQQTTPPTGWTKITTSTDAALRVVSGTVGSGGGSDGFSSVFGTGKSTSGYALTISDMPAHDHSGLTGNDSPDHSHAYTSPASGVGTGSTPDYFSSGTTSTNTGGASARHKHTISSQGGGGSHSHSLTTLNLKYVDCVVASKD